MAFDELKSTFDWKFQQWNRDTRFLSGGFDDHPSHRWMIKQGEAILPLIFEHMLMNGVFVGWFDVLDEIADDLPVDREDWGKVAVIQWAWLNWAIDHGYLKLR